MQKVKRGFQLANKDISSEDVYMIQNWFTLFGLNSCLTFTLSIACSTLSQSNSSSIAIRQWNKYIHTEHFKKTTICFNWKEAICSSTKKTENKKEKLTELLPLTTVEMTRRSNYNLSLNHGKLCINTITAEITKRL